MRLGPALLIAVVMTLPGRTAQPITVPPLLLEDIGHVAPKGRVQDKAYNPHLPIVDRLISVGPAAIPFLVSDLEDDTEIHGPVFDYWPRVTVADVALVILIDFFTTPDGRPTVPEMAWDSLLDRQEPDAPAWVVLSQFITKHGRSGIRRKVEGILRPYAGRFEWVGHEMCFRPKEDKH